jgi:1,4-alpha-glucan branching enzyme
MPEPVSPSVPLSRGDFLKPFFAGNRYSAKKMAKPVNFVCTAPGAKKVSLIGDFNNWDPAANPMKRQPDGAWLLQVALSHGHHHYRFLIDGRPALDPRAQGVARDPKGEKASLIAVS